MNEFLDTLMDFFIDLASTILISLICILIRHSISWVKQKIKNGYIKQALDELESLVIDGIFYTEQTLVSVYKEKGEWNEETKNEVLSRCLLYVQDSLTEKSKTYLTEENKTSIESLIIGKIEAKLGELHYSKI